MAQKFLDLSGLATLVTNIKDYISNLFDGNSSLSTPTKLAASKVLITNSAGKVATSNATSTDVGYINGLTANVQNQINAANGNISTNAGNISTNATNISTINSRFTNGVLKVANGGTGVSNLSSLSVGTATNATTASKLGSSTVGSGVSPIYLNAGTATASTSSVGSKSQPVYLNAGTLTGGIKIQYGTSLPASGSDGDIFILISA